jgi:alpha-ketoglutarate-dependent taurine dioxygenase
MEKKILILDLTNLENLAKTIKKFFINHGDYVIIKNYNNLISDEEILNIYEKINTFIGKSIPIDLEKNTYKPTLKIWADVNYTYDSDEKQFWRSSNHQNLHTDNTFCAMETYGNLTELVCFKTSEYSGNTTLISNDFLIELIKFVDEHKNETLYESILDREIYHSAGNNLYLKRKILEFNEKYNKYLFCFNFFPATRGKNDENNNIIINKLNSFLEEKIMCSDLMDEVKLNRGDAIIFNDENVLHGRRSFIGTRHYKKTAIQLDECSIFDYHNIKLEER